MISARGNEFESACAVYATIFPEVKRGVHALTILADSALADIEPGKNKSPHHQPV